MAELAGRDRLTAVALVDHDDSPSRRYGVMPIKFRCPNCHQFLGISRSKAGEVSDCPMCGKTLRVPDLDGTVRPLPTPELNLEDSSLVDALGELAGIGSQSETEGRDSPDAEEFRIVGERAAPEPITLEPLVPAKPVSPADDPGGSPQSTRKTTVSATGDDGTIDDPDAELRTIAASSARTRRSKTKSAPRTRRRHDRHWVERAAIAGGCLVVGFGLAWLLSPANPAQTEGMVANQPAGGEHADGHDQAIRKANGAPAVTGRVTYVTESGDTRPDDGAKVMALPEDRNGTVKLDVAGFLVGSTIADEMIAAASLRALGGDLTTVDDEGEYAIKLEESGDYQLLVISRHQSRSWEDGLEEDLQELLARFFIRPSALLGQLEYDLRGLQYRGQGTATRDFAFERE